jgi:hypothetical protein
LPSFRRAKRVNRQNDIVAAKILEPVGKRIKFTYPAGEPDMTGVLKDRAFIRSPASVGVPYWDVVDLIEFPDAPERDWIRIGYYREKPTGRLRWGSQTTITEPIGTWKTLLIHAAREKAWFRRLLQDVVKQVQKER